jgi:hypothetical protein
VRRASPGADRSCSTSAAEAGKTKRNTIERRAALDNLTVISAPAAVPRRIEIPTNRQPRKAASQRISSPQRELIPDSVSGVVPRVITLLETVTWA